MGKPSMVMANTVLSGSVNSVRLGAITTLERA